MSTVVDLNETEARELLDLTQQPDLAHAVKLAMAEYIRHAKRMQLKRLSGKVTLEDNWREQEDAELREGGSDAS